MDSIVLGISFEVSIILTSPKSEVGRECICHKAQGSSQQLMHARKDRVLTSHATALIIQWSSSHLLTSKCSCGHALSTTKGGSSATWIAVSAQHALFGECHWGHAVYGRGLPHVCTRNTHAREDILRRDLHAHACCVLNTLLIVCIVVSVSAPNANANLHGGRRPHWQE